MDKEREDRELICLGISGKAGVGKHGPRTQWFCPNGHSRHYTQGEQEKNEIANLRNRLDVSESRARHLEDQKRATERSLIATKAAHTRTKNRIARGVCTECSRTFENLQRHYQSKHPELAGNK